MFIWTIKKQLWQPCRNFSVRKVIFWDNLIDMYTNPGNNKKFYFVCFKRFFWLRRLEFWQQNWKVVVQNSKDKFSLKVQSIKKLRNKLEIFSEKGPQNISPDTENTVLTKLPQFCWKNSESFYLEIWFFFQSFNFFWWVFSSLKRSL